MAEKERDRRKREAHARKLGATGGPMKSPPHCDWLYGWDRASLPQEGNDQ
jgi:hypothetical protein